MRASWPWIRPDDAVSELETLTDLLDAAWMHMARGVSDRKHGFHLPVVSTVRDGQPTGRVVVLRVAERASRTLLFHTDLRAQKTQELGDGVAFTFYDARRRLQLRATGSARLAEPELTDARWDASNNPARKCYLVTPAPGTPLAEWQSGHTGELDQGRVPTTDETHFGRQNFAVVVTQVHTLEVLRVERLGHRRARFTWTCDGWNGTWLQA